ncbi:TRAP transporter permease [Bacillus sp. Marseille-P3661]|uniref:TRAP transporter permease n=1 Tax=Bacillus sp. Marseille-P3661 TaxID=1936234 RepID=UPI000C82D85F|nr:TRAP transporter permease [Bacillus sp. Marseille-P3661]
MKKNLVIASAICIFISVLVLAFQIFHFSSEGRILPVFLMLTLVYVFITKPLKEGSDNLIFKIVDFILVIGSIVPGVYLSLFYDSIQLQAGVPSTTVIIMGIITLVVLLEAVRRIVGLPLAILAVIFILYAIVGPYLPRLLMHRGYDWSSIMDRLYLSSGGFYGLPLATMFRYVVIFVIFGAFLEKTGTGDFLINISKAIAGRYRGGVGQISVLSSSLMGSISGSSVANVATTGTITIPAMKKTGFSPQMAGAVEAVASNGGQILPPVMGAAAFLMADFLGIPYSQVMLAALIPAIMYFISVSANIYIYSSMNNIKGLPKSEIPNILKEIKNGWYYLIPFIILISFLLNGYSPTFSGLLGIASVIIVGFLKPKNRLTFKGIIESLQSAGESVVLLTVASGAAGIVVGVLTLTGLGNRLSSVLITISGENVFLLLVLSMVVSIILGMGMPTTVVYIMLATLVAPAIIELGILPMAAHLFIIYFGTMSMITPPVALATYAGAAIAGADPVKTSMLALKIALPCYIIPFYFVFNNALLLQGENGLLIAWSIVTALVGIISFSIALMGYAKRKLSTIQRTSLLIGSLLLIHQGLVTDFIAIAILLAFIIIENKKVSVIVDKEVKL